jgi:hypothetical protein
MVDDLEVYVEPQVTVSGNFPTLQRVKTGLFSLDYALSQQGNLGLPLRVITELYGYTNVGKSTLSYYLAGKVASEMGGSISVADLEFNDIAYIPRAVGASAYKGDVRMMDVTDEKGKPLSHERILMSLSKDLLKDSVASVVWDSIGATQSEVQMDVLLDPKGNFGEAFMGKRAKLVGDIVNALRTALITKKLPSTAILINHVHQVIGGRGHLTPGGERKGYLAGTRIMLRPSEVFREDDGDSGSAALGFLVEGQVEKLRFGGKGRKFWFYIVPGFGVHPGVSAMFDAFEFGLAERGSRVKLDGKSLGFLKADLLTYAAEGKRRKFYPFEEAMQRYAEDVERGHVSPSPVDDEADEDQ